MNEWRRTYPTKPGWWDDDYEPRCDECGVHTEDAIEHVNPLTNFDRYPDGWCGDCGCCADHCACVDAPCQFCGFDKADPIHGEDYGRDGHSFVNSVLAEEIKRANKDLRLVRFEEKS